MDDIEKIKQKADIVDVIGEIVTLKKTGNNFKGLCPFHSEKSPSFVVSPDRQIWHCFGCSKGGDIFTFLQEYEKLDFADALKILAQRTGITLTGSYKKTGTEEKKEKIEILNSLSAQFYHYLLTKHPIGKSALSYLLDKRKIHKGLIEKFQLGYAPQAGNLLTQYLNRKKKYALQDITDAGLISMNDGRPYDFFRNRIMFPLCDARDTILGFSGRALTNEILPKYVNTRETLIYKKGDTLFGLNFAKEAIKKEGKVIIVEGEFDVISSFHEGIQNVVAVKGTALSQNQIRTLKRYAQKFTFCFDTDLAGTEAQRRSISLIEKEGVTASVIIPPHGKDPDELLHENPAEFKQAIKHDINIFDFIINSAVNGLDPTTAEAKKTILGKTLPFLTGIENEVIKEHYLKKLAQILETSYDAVLREVEKTAKARISIPPPPQPLKTREERTEEYLLSLVLQSPNPHLYCTPIRTIISDVSFSIPAYDRLFQLLLMHCAENSIFSLPNLIKSLPAELLPVFDRVYLAPLPPFKSEVEYMEEVEKTAKDVKMLSIKSRLTALSERIREKEKVNADEADTLKMEFNRLTQLLH